MPIPTPGSEKALGTLVRYCVDNIELLSAFDTTDGVTYQGMLAGWLAGSRLIYACDVVKCVDCPISINTSLATIHK